MSDRIPSYPLRMPPELRSVLEERAKESGRSLNAEIVQMLDEAINEKVQSYEISSNVKVVRIPSKAQRIIKGILVSDIDVDYSQESLDDLRQDIEVALNSLQQIKPQKLGLRVIAALNDFTIFQGNNHLKVLINGKDKNWLTVEDHLI